MNNNLLKKYIKKIKNLGYSVPGNESGKFIVFSKFSTNKRYLDLILLDKEDLKISFSLETIKGIQSQEDIDELQIEFNRLKNWDVEEILKWLGFVIIAQSII